MRLDETKIVTTGLGPEPSCLAFSFFEFSCFYFSPCWFRSKKIRQRNFLWRHGGHGLLGFSPVALWPHLSDGCTLSKGKNSFKKKGPPKESGPFYHGKYLFFMAARPACCSSLSEASKLCALTFRLVSL